MKIEINLLSDLCLASGDVHNSLIDVDVVYDKYGLPYIPAKRLKGCIREAALELLEFDLISEEEYVQLFGKEGNSRSAFSISNGYLEHREEYIKSLESCPYDELTNVQNVINQFSYLRKQTSVDLKTGVAQDGSLRTIRVVKKGLKFVAECHWNQEVKNDKQLQYAISLVKHMGLNRTRGLGLVDMKLITKEEQKKVTHVSEKVHSWLRKKSNHKEDAIYKLNYSITLNSPLICKSAQGNQAVSEDYIAGSKVLGLIAKALKNEEYQKLMAEHEIIVSNAYIKKGDNRCVPAEISLQKEKDQKYQVNDHDEVMNVCNMIAINPDEVKQKQMTPANISYWDCDHEEMEVECEISYHHRRPDDKSIGRASGEGNSTLYQLSSISEGQSFSGSIYATYHQIITIKNAISKMKNIRMGYGRQNGFGDVSFMIDTIECISKEASNIIHEAQVVFLSDVIVYNSFGMATTDISTLLQYLKDILNVDDLCIQKPYLTFSNIGGYNVTWQARKPLLCGLGKGTTFILSSKQGFDVELLKHTFIGERTYEGYGELLVKEHPQKQINVKRSYIVNKHTSKDYWNNDLMNALLQDECKKQIQLKIVDIVQNNSFLSKMNVERLNIIVSKLRILVKNETSYKAMENELKQIEKDSTRTLGLKVIEIVNPKVILEDITNCFNQKYNTKFVSQWSDETLFKEVYEVYISYLKYYVKCKKGEGVEDE